MNDDEPENAPPVETSEPVDWLGRPVSCQDCPHAAFRLEGRCDLGRICVRDQRARRIDRFFAANTELAGSYLEHPYFEVRVLAAKHAPVFQLMGLMSDSEPDVRVMLAYRLPLVRLGTLKVDPDRKVR
ncbi:MAG: 4Fe4S-binding leucine-rich repeat protein, partial [Alphaproteobacteria bacterium]